MKNSPKLFRPLRYLAVLAFIACLLPAARAQNAELAGAILDSQGLAISGATITVTNENTDVHRQTVSTATGNYNVPALAPGSYTIRVQKDGFETMERAGITLNVATVTRLDLRLIVGGKQETVTVNGGSPLLQTADATFGEVVENKDIVTLALNGRSYTELAALAPGVAFGGTNASIGTVLGYTIENPTLGTGGNFTISGSRPEGNAFTMDGIDVTANFQGGTIAYPPIDGIQEFRLLQSNYDAEFGGHTGQIVLTTKSGTNDFHGSFYEFLRNNDLDANNFFSNLAGIGQSPLKQNQFGGAIGGPVYLPKYSGKDRTFFFVNYEGGRVSAGGTQTTTVPTVRMLGGDFSQLSTPVIDPQTGRPFPGNVIPAARISPIALNVIQLTDYPLPNTTGLVNNYTTAPVTRTNLDQVLARIDHTLSQKDNVWGSIYWLKEANSTPRFTTFESSAESVPAQVYSLHETHIFSPTLLNDAKGGWTYTGQTFAIQTPQTVTDADLGFPDDGAHPQPIGRAAGIPLFSASGYGTLGIDTLNPRFYRAEHYELGDALSWLKKSHAFKFGAEFVREHDDEWSAGNARGQYAFNGQYSKNGFADFMLGLPSSASQAIYLNGQEDVIDYGLRMNHYAAYAQDVWSVSQNLTINLGLRYEKHTPPVEIKNRQANWYLGPTGIVEIFAPDKTYGRSLGIAANKDFAPRLGITYQPGSDHKTVLRAGYGVAYDNLPPNHAADLPYNAPWDESIAVTNTSPNPIYELASSFLPSLVAASLAPEAIDLNRLDGRVQQWTLGVERELGHRFLLDLTYLGSATDQLDAYQSLNAAFPGPGSFASRRPYPSDPVITTVKDNGRANYQAGTIQIKRDFSKGFSLTSHYTWGKSLDDTSSQDETALQNAEYNLRSNWGLSGFNVGRRFVGSAVYELPFGKGKALLNDANGFVNALVGGWSVAPIYTIQSGFPFSPIASSNTANIEAGILRPNQIGKTSIANRSRLEWFNTSAFAQPAPYQYGNAGRNSLVGPGLKDLDVAMIKETELTERFHLQFRGEFFNAFNNVNFNNPSGSYGTTTFGVISSAGNARIIQFGAKVLF
jgi:hypothetical protein